MALTIPLKTHWPVGFRSNYITAFPDFAVYISWRKLRIGKIDGRPIGWWHDLGYWRGMIVHPDIKLSELRKLQPLPNAQRSEVKRRAIDLQLYAHARQLRYTEVKIGRAHV